MIADTVHCLIGLAAPSVTDSVFSFPPSFSVKKRLSILIFSHWGICLFQQALPSPTPPFFTRALKCGSQEMKRLRQVKLSSSPHRTFLVVIHSWQNPFTLWQPMSPLIYGVVSCHDPRNVHWSPYSVAPPPPSLAHSSRLCVEYRFGSGRMWRWVWGGLFI